MIIKRPFQKILLSLLLAGAAAAPALAQISVNIQVAPPQPQYEAVPALAPSQAWAPGYWAWTGDRHVWVRGQTLMKRDGYHWAPDRWEQRGNSYQRHAGYWVRDSQPGPGKGKKDKKDKKDKGGKHGQAHGRDHGKGHGR